MTIAGRDDRILPGVKLAALLDSLRLGGMAPEQTLASLDLTERELRSPETRVSINQMLQCCRNASRMLTDPGCAYRTGARLHASAYGLWGLAMLSSTNFRRALRFVAEYREFTTPLIDISYLELGNSVHLIAEPIIRLQDDPALYRFLVELHFGMQASLLRGVMGSQFTPREARVCYPPPQSDGEILPCPVLFDQTRNALLIDRAWCDRPPEPGDELQQMLRFCQQLLEEAQCQTVLAGKDRGASMVRLTPQTSLETIADAVRISPRALRRSLPREGTSFQQLSEEVRTHLAMQYLRETTLSMDDVAYSLGFNEGSSFRHAFKRWTGTAPGEFRSRTAAGG